MAPRAVNAGAVAQEVEAPMHEAPYSPKTQMRFWTKVKAGRIDECWEWQASKTTFGYGQIGLEGQKVNGMAHRVAYELLVGPIPEGLHIDHLCRNPGCVNPAHMEPVTCAENLLRGEGVSAINARKSHCDAGHELAGENLYVDPRGRRQCRACRSAVQKKRQDAAYWRAYRARRAVAGRPVGTQVEPSELRDAR